MDIIIIAQEDFHVKEWLHVLHRHANAYFFLGSTSDQSGFIIDSWTFSYLVSVINNQHWTNAQPCMVVESPTSEREMHKYITSLSHLWETLLIYSRRLLLHQSRVAAQMDRLSCMIKSMEVANTPFYYNKQTAVIWNF